MAYNNGAAWKKFRAQTNKMLHDYVKAGVPYKKLKKIYRFEYLWFKSCRVHQEHNQLIGDCTDDEGYLFREDMSPLLNRYFDKFSVEALITDPDRRDAWIDEIDDEEMLKSLKMLSPVDIAILTLSVYEGFTHKEIGKMMRIPRATVTWRIGKIRKILKKA